MQRMKIPLSMHVTLLTNFYTPVNTTALRFRTHNPEKNTASLHKIPKANLTKA